MPVDVSNESEWRRFEVESWRKAMRERGLQLRCLDTDQQRAVFDALHLPNFGASLQKLALRVPDAVRRIGAVVLIMSAGYLAHDLTPAAKHVAAQLNRYYQIAACSPYCEDTLTPTQ